MKSLLKLNKYFLRYKYHLLLGALFITVSNIFSIIPAMYVRRSIDLLTSKIGSINAAKDSIPYDILKSELTSQILIYGILILSMALVKGFFLYLTRQTIIVMSRHIEYDMKNEIYAHYQTLPLSFYRSHNTGDLMNRISEDVSRVRMYIGPAVMYGLNLIVLFVLVISYMVSINRELTFYALLPLPLLSVCIYFVSNRINRQSEKIQRSLSDLSTFVQEAFSGIRVLKAFVREKDSAKAFFNKSNQYRDKSLKLSMINALFYPTILSMIGLSTIFTIYIGSKAAIAGEVSVGNIAEFVIYINMLTWPVTSVGWVTSIVQRAAASQERLDEFMDTKTTIVSEKNISTPIKGEISFENVSLTYPDSGIKAIDNLSFKVNAGKTLAIIGATGSGKSTIANLVCRMYDPNQGRILVDGVDLKDYNTSHLRSKIGYVPQDTFLFSDSIINNIAFGSDKSYNKEEVHKAAMLADVYENIITFPEGFNTVLGERGITLSGGQKQRVSIARAIIRNPQILILDDCLSAVDTHTENAILNNLSGIMQEKTTLIIAHRVSTVKLADSILVLEEGKVIEQGTHNELLTLGGLYRQLYESQLEKN